MTGTPPALMQRSWRGEGGEGETSDPDLNEFLGEIERDPGSVANYIASMWHFVGLSSPCPPCPSAWPGWPPPGAPAAGWYHGQVQWR